VIVMRRTSIAVLGILTVAVVLSPGQVALADGCDLLDLGCTIDAGVPTDAGEVVDDVTGTVDDVLGTAEDPAEPVVDPVIDVVEDVLGGGGTIEPPGGEDPGDGPTERPGSGSDRERDRSPAGGAPTGPTALLRDPVATTAPAATTTSISAISGEARSTDRGGSGGFVADALRGVMLMAVLFAISIGFVLVQDLLDRNDPKLAVAAVRPEVVTFA
jgi:hypothetical protein